MLNNLTMHADNSLTIGISKDGLPAATAIVPAPFIDEPARQQAVEAARRQLLARGFVVTSVRRVRNVAFDAAGETTSTEIRFRVPKTRREALGLMAQIERLAETFDASKAEAMK